MKMKLIVLKTCFNKSGEEGDGMHVLFCDISGHVHRLQCGVRRRDWLPIAQKNEQPLTLHQKQRGHASGHPHQYRRANMKSGSTPANVPGYSQVPHVGKAVDR